MAMGAQVFAVGVLEFEDPAIPGWPARGRQDVELVELLRRQGAAEIVLLTDHQATLAAIEQRFAALLDRSAPGQTLIVYYAGHGWLDGGEVGFAPWDVREAIATTWRVESIVETIEHRFSGDRVLLLADCCHSGSLADIAARQEASSPIAWAAIGAAQVGEHSTGTWLFTETLIEGFGGSARADTDRDGVVTFGELQRFVAGEMAFGVDQRIGAYVGRFGASTPVARTIASREMVGERMEVLAEGTWWKAKVLQVEPGTERVKVRYYGWDASEDEWVDPERVRRPNARADVPDGRR